MTGTEALGWKGNPRGWQEMAPPDAQRKKQHWDSVWYLVLDTSEAVSLRPLRTVMCGFVCRVNAGHCEKPLAVGTSLEMVSWHFKGDVVLSTISPNVCHPLQAFPGAWQIQLTLMLVGDSEKPGKEQVSLKVWKGGTSPEPDSFRVTWDRTPLKKHKRWSRPRWGQGTFSIKEFLQGTHRQRESESGQWNTACPF
jgi:hypothetical protein